MLHQQAGQSVADNRCGLFASSLASAQKCDLHRFKLFTGQSRSTASHATMPASTTQLGIRQTHQPAQRQETSNRTLLAAGKAAWHRIQYSVTVTAAEEQPWAMLKQLL